MKPTNAISSVINQERNAELSPTSTQPMLDALAWLCGRSLTTPQLFLSSPPALQRRRAARLLAAYGRRERPLHPAGAAEADPRAVADAVWQWLGARGEGALVQAPVRESLLPARRVLTSRGEVVGAMHAFVQALPRPEREVLHRLCEVLHHVWLNSGNRLDGLVALAEAFAPPVLGEPRAVGLDPADAWCLAELMGLFITDYRALFARCAPRAGSLEQRRKGRGQEARREEPIQEEADAEEVAEGVKEDAAEGMNEDNVAEQKKEGAAEQRKEDVAEQKKEDVAEKKEDVAEQKKGDVADQSSLTLLPRAPAAPSSASPASPSPRPALPRSPRPARPRWSDPGPRSPRRHAPRQALSNLPACPLPSVPEDCELSMDDSLNSALESMLAQIAHAALFGGGSDQTGSEVQASASEQGCVPRAEQESEGSVCQETHALVSTQDHALVSTQDHALVSTQAPDVASHALVSTEVLAAEIKITEPPALDSPSVLQQQGSDASELTQAGCCSTNLSLDSWTAPGELSSPHLDLCQFEPDWASLSPASQDAPSPTTQASNSQERADKGSAAALGSAVPHSSRDAARSEVPEIATAFSLLEIKVRDTFRLHWNAPGDCAAADAAAEDAGFSMEAVPYPAVPRGPSSEVSPFAVATVAFRPEPSSPRLPSKRSPLTFSASQSCGEDEAGDALAWEAMLPAANPSAECDSVDGDWSIPARPESRSPSLVSTPVCLDGRVARQLSEGSFEGGPQLSGSPSLEEADGEECCESALLRKKPLSYVLDRSALFDASCETESPLQTEPSSPDGYTSAFSSLDKLSEGDSCSLRDDQCAETWDGDESDLERRTLVSRLRCSSFSEKRASGKLLEQRSKLRTDPPRPKMRERKGRRGGWWRLATFRPFAGSSRRTCAEADVEALLGGDGGEDHAKISSYSTADQELAAAAGRLQRLRLFRSKRG